MEWIDKQNDAAANAIIDPYLAWAKTQRWYGVDCGRKLYEKLGLRRASSRSARHRLIDDVLLPEQNHLCCYCMREIRNHGEEASIEHVIPQHTGLPVRMTRYFSHGGLNSSNVCLTNDYVAQAITGPPYPHHVAYHNFVAACIKCNSSRGHHEIEPLFFRKDVHDEVTYNRATGEAEWLLDPAYSTQIPELPTLEKIKINRPLLKAIRAIWFYARRESIDPHSADRQSLVYGALGDSLMGDASMTDDEFNAYLGLLTDDMWSLLLKYNYFGR